MRFKINLGKDSLPIEDVVTETSKRLNRVLGQNHKWHDLENKPYTCSLLLGGKQVGKRIEFDNSYFYLNSDCNEVIETITSNFGINFDIEYPKVFKAYNLLSVKRVRFNKNGRTEWVTEENENEFISYVKDKYGVGIEVLKIQNTVLRYKNDSKISVSNLLIRTDGDKNVANLFESGIGGSCSLGFGFVSTINNN